MVSHNYQKQLNEIGWSLCSIAIATTFARCYCRVFIVRRFGWDDTFMVLAMLSGVACVVLVSVAISFGFGRHLGEITDKNDGENAIKYNLIAPCLSIVSSTCSKISMVLFMLRLLGPTTTRLHKWLLGSVTVAMTVLNIFIIIVLIAFCKPVEKSWKPEVPGKCLPNTVFSIGGRFQAIWNALMDLVTAGFPVYMVHQLNMKRSTKWGLSFLMGGGVVACVATLIKVAKMGGLSQLDDITYTWGPIAIWYMVEIYVLVIAGSIPILKPIWTKIRRTVSTTLVEPKGSNNSASKSASTGSKRSKTFGIRQPGSVTLALQDIDNMTKKTTGGSEEDIVPLDKVVSQPHLHADEHGGPTRSAKSRNSSPDAAIAPRSVFDDENRR